jgi:molybdopterin-guanine dinucleotide biosynthesis protein A
MTKRAALVLSGGKASRFQAQSQDWKDKALAQLEAKPLLVPVVENVKDIVDEVIVCVNGWERKEIYRDVLEQHGLNVKLVIDEKTEISGPNVAILTGLKAAQADQYLVVPCDMPFVKPQVANYLFTLADGFDVVVPMWPNGRLETLIMILQRTFGLEIVETLCKLKRPRSDDIPRAASKTLLASPMKTIKTLDPTFKSFTNINAQEDIKKLQTRRLQGPVQDHVQLIQGVLSVSDLQLIRKAAKMRQEGNFKVAEETFDLCKHRFEFGSRFFWAGVAGEGKGETLLEHSQQLKGVEPELSLKRDFEGKEAFFVAANSYRGEAEISEKKRCLLLMHRALEAKSWCESWVMGKSLQQRWHKLKTA